MSIVLTGLSHHTAPVEVREGLAVVDEEPEETLKGLVSLADGSGGFYLSTCNRVEFLVATDSGPTPEATLAEILAFFSPRCRLEEGLIREHLFLKTDREAVEHLFRVASSLDSMIVGEPQILGQLKEAYRRASQSGTLGVTLNRLLHRAFSVAKRVRHETGISDHAVSVSFAAVQMAKKIFGLLDGKQALLIGAGEMAELAAEHLLGQGAAGLTVANRTLERAMEVVGRVGGAAVSLDELEEVLIKADIVITSTAATEPVITAPLVKKTLRPRKHRPLFFIDIAVPRDVEEAVGRLENVYLYDIDDLTSVVARNLEERQQEARRAERIVAEEAIRFEEWRETLAVVPTIKSIQAALEKVRQGEMKKTLSSLDLTPAEIEALEAMTRAMTKKILHHPAVFLKRRFRNPQNRTRYLEAAHRLFGLDEGGEGE